MLNEIEEFKAYTTFPVYTAKNKFDAAYLGRFTYDTLLEKHGLVRVFTILARGYVWEKDTPDLMRGRRALCAWCSLPTGRKGSRQDASDDWQKAPVSFGNLHDEFPILVTENGSGWYYRHIRNIVRFSKRNEGLISQDALKHCAALEAKFKKAWADDLVRFQIPLYSPGTRAMWGLRFDDILADALLQGPLQNYEIPLPEELLTILRDATPGRIPKEVLPTLFRYYLAHKQPDTDWVVLPVANFDAYFGTTSFGRTWLSRFPTDILERTAHPSVSRFRPGKRVQEYLV